MRWVVAFRVGGYAACHYHPYAAAGTFGKVSGQFLIALVTEIFMTGMHGPHHDAVFQTGKSQVQGAEDVRVGLGHGRCHLVVVADFPAM